MKRGKTIEKKILPEYFKAVKDRTKTFELRKDDSDYQVGDILKLREWDGSRYTGNVQFRQITYILRDCPEYGLQPGYCILAMKEKDVNVMYEPKKVTAVLKIVVTSEFYDEEASEETLRYCIEQDLEDIGYDVDVSVLK